MGVKNWEEFIKDIPTDALMAELERRKEENKNNIKASPIAFDIMEEIDDALIQFGHYTFGDKGPYEVMSISTYSHKLKSKPVKEIAGILTQVLDNYESYSSVGSYRHAEDVVNTIVGEMDDMEWFDELFQYDDRFDY